MTLYNNEEKLVEYDLQPLSSEGEQGVIYRNSEGQCIKIWTGLGYRPLSHAMFLKIQKLQLQGYYQLISMLYANKLDARTSKNAVGYYYHHCSEEKIDILTMPIDYTLENLNRLYESNRILTENNIRSVDLQEENVILNKNDITVIDVDSYLIDRSLPQSKLKTENLYDLESLFIDLYKSAMKEYHLEIEPLLPIDLLYNLFNLTTSQPVSTISKKLKKYQYPIDYIKANIKFYERKK